MTEKQRILVFQQKKSGIEKASAVGENPDLDVKWVSVDEELPDFLETPEEYLPSEIDADLVLNHLPHPDLSDELGRICEKCGVPVVAAGKKHRYADNFTPPTCCGLPKSDVLGRYGEYFGEPELDVVLSKEGATIDHITVVRGAPCGATARIAERLKGAEVSTAAHRIGLEVQYECKADPAGWDPIYGKSPVHFAGKIHAAALEKALKEKGIVSVFPDLSEEESTKGE